MNQTTNFHDKEGIDKLKHLVAKINVCLFCTNLKTDDGSTCRQMSAQKVCDQGNIWFFSDVHSDKSREIKKDKHVRLFFSHPGKNSYLFVKGEAEIIIDKQKTDELWTPLVETWFKGGKDDPNISITKVKPITAYYWNSDGNRMIDFLKMVASVGNGGEFGNWKRRSFNGLM